MARGLDIQRSELLLSLLYLLLLMRFCLKGAIYGYKYNKAYWDHWG